MGLAPESEFRERVERRRARRERKAEQLQKEAKEILDRLVG